MFIFITFITNFRYHGQIHLNKLQPESCPCIQESISKNNHENRAKNGKFFTVEFAQKASHPIKFSPTFGTGYRYRKKGFFGFSHHKRCACSQASFPAIQDENGQQNGKFFTVASALLFFFQTLPPKPHCAPNKREIKKAVLIQLAFHFVAGDLYPLATDSDSLENGPLTLKSVSL